jgi:succinyldiaminopimelate transaminase
MLRLNPLVEKLSIYPIVELDRRKAEILRQGRKLYDFGTGDPVEPTPPFIRQALLDAVDPVCPYPAVAGKPGVRKAIAAYLERRFGAQLDANTQILPTAGSKEVCFHTPQLVIDPTAEDRLVAFPDPGYPAYERGALFCGGEPYPVRLSGDFVFRPHELPVEILRRTRMIWINTPHNPTGAVMSRDDLMRAAEVCEAHGILLASDETYADVYQDERPHSLCEVARSGYIVVHSLSKRSGVTGYRTGFIAGNADTIHRLKSLRANPGLVPQDFVNAAAEVAWTEESHVEARRQVFAAKKAVMMDFFREVGIEVAASQATIYLWIRTPAGHTDEAYASRLLEAGIVLSPGAFFGVAGGGEGYLRLALVPSVEECRAACALWKTLL